MGIAITFVVTGLIFGAQDAGHLGGCAITCTDGYYLLECTYGSIADCQPGNLECETMVYGAPIEGDDVLTEAYNLLDHYRAAGFDKMPIPMSAAPVIITNSFHTNECE